MPRPLLALLLTLGALAALDGCAMRPSADRPTEARRGLALDSARLVADIRALSADSMEGRRTGSAGGREARAYIADAFSGAGLTPFAGGFVRPFAFRAGRDSTAYEGANVVGYVPGTARTDRYLVVSAHYDHLGVRDGQIYNGADDNASGTAALLALVRYFREHPPRHSVVFAGLDAEELGLRGARAFVADPPVPREAIVANVNMDMLSRNEAGELYVAGTHHSPFLLPYVERVAARAPVTLRVGHDRPELPPGDDWTRASDHGPFHDAGIAFLYFGVEDHPDYHKPTDDFVNIDPGFFVRAARTVAAVVVELDQNLDTIAERTRQ